MQIRSSRFPNLQTPTSNHSRTNLLRTMFAICPTQFSMTRFDRLVILVSLALGAVCAFLVWRSVVEGMRVVAFSPGADAQNVSTRSKIQITFDQALSATL